MNKRILLAATVVLGVLFNSCMSDQSPAFLAKLYATGPAGSSETSWVLVSNTQGQVIAQQVVARSGFIELKGVPTLDGKIVVTTFRATTYQQGGTNVHYGTFISTQAVPVGTIFENDITAYVDYPDVKGNSSLKLTDYNDSDRPIEAVRFEESFGGYDLYSAIPPINVGGSLTFDFKVRNNPSDILATGYRNNQPVYKWVKNSKPGDAITVSWNDFTPQNIIPASKKLNSALVFGYNDAQSDRGYTLTSSTQWLASNSSKSNSSGPLPGYIDGFAAYEVRANFSSVNSSSVSYYKKGSIPSMLTYPDYVFTPSGTKPTDFSFEFSVPYNYQTLRFGGGTTGVNLTWVFKLPSGDKIIPPRIPDEIMQRYPGINLAADALKISRIELTQNISNASFEDVMLRPSVRRDTFEFLIFSFLIQ